MSFELAIGYLVVALIFAIPALTLSISVYPRVDGDFAKAAALGAGGFFGFFSLVVLIRLFLWIADDLALYISQMGG